jgi:hypothetical protein
MTDRGLLIHFKMNRPRDHWREVSCLEIGCVNHAMGWRTILPADDIANIELIRRSGMGFREEREDGLVIFVFTPGQECFTGQGGGHRIAVERQPILMRDQRVMEHLEFMDNWNDHQYRRSVNNG